MANKVKIDKVGGKPVHNGSVHLKKPGVVRVEGITKEHICLVTCVLISEGEVRTRIALSGDSRWQVNLHHLGAGKYRLIGSAMDAACNCVKVTVGPKRQWPRPRLSLQCQGNGKVTANGTVNTAQNPVTCTLAGASGPDTKHVTPNPTNWSVDFGPKPPGNYMVTSTASGEGMLQCSATVH